MRVKQPKQPKSHKKAASIVAIGAVAVLMLSGTFAWFGGTSVQNIFTGSATPTPTPGNAVVLHDDFQAPTKYVYVENTGTEPIYVRLQLSEAMGLGTNTVPAQADIQWDVHAPVKVGSSLDHKDLNHLNPADPTEKFHDYFHWTWGGQKDYLPAEAGTNGSTDEYKMTPAQISAALAANGGVRNTTPAMNVNGGVLSADWYLNQVAGAPFPLDPVTDYVGWIYCEDGWAYWSQPLLPGTATGPIISAVTADASLDGQAYWYIIDVKLESVDAADLPTWIAQADSLGQQVLTTIGGIPVPTP